MKLSEQVALLTEEITSMKNQIAALEKEVSKIKVETSNFVRAKNIKAEAIILDKVEMIFINVFPWILQTI